MSAKPFVKWVGGKRQMLEQYEEFFPEEYGTYHEPMVGGGAVFFHLEPQKAVINDLNKDLVVLYQTVRDSVDSLVDKLVYLKDNHSKEFYHGTIRPKFNELKLEYSKTELDKIPTAVKNDLAAYFVYLNKTGFNGLYRVNSKGEFNVPCGKYENPNICDKEVLQNASKALQGTEVCCDDYKQVLKRVNKNDFVYIDPPYDPVTETANFTGYTKDGFGKDDQADLAFQFRKLDKIGAKVMLSNSGTDFIKHLYQGFKVHEVEANRFVNSNGDKRGKIAEALITNY